LAEGAARHYASDTARSMRLKRFTSTNHPALPRLKKISPHQGRGLKKVFVFLWSG